MIEKKLESYQNYSIKKYSIRSIWQFYSVINLCVSFLKINGIDSLSKKDIRMRNKIYGKIAFKKKISQKELNKITNFMNKDMNIITITINLLDELKEKNSSDVINFEKDNFIAILGSELEDML